MKNTGRCKLRRKHHLPLGTRESLSNNRNLIVNPYRCIVHAPLHYKMFMTTLKDHFNETVTECDYFFGNIGLGECKFKLLRNLNDNFLNFRITCSSSHGSRNNHKDRFRLREIKMWLVKIL
mmetsp:Transcript_16224/g.32304  ORF Transcript_16224/g.32304 Transcript_16224/m.32304 type:complete len:121 (-) Transcript_16224:542-904(-)